jgi:lipopolysaccharide/colanic/teichoic acid biosynthesis glycosyltransferase
MTAVTPDQHDQAAATARSAPGGTPDRATIVAEAAREGLVPAGGVDAVLRTLDLGIAGAALTVFSPLMALIAIAIRLTSGRPVLYRGHRIGRFGVVFTMYKFRTLAPDAETRLGPLVGEELTRRTNAEVTRLGRVLRAVYLDELPQLINVVRGDMSLVGPRPIRPAYYERLTDVVPNYWQRLVVRPGLTGFAQIRVTRELSWEEKLAHDLEFIADRSVRLYLTAIAATAVRVIARAFGADDGSSR